ncbi:hypothetical protein [Acidithiobacillus ferriphilus]|uniref:hypothetical protein n=1 Tax=Acidithiobacillus ferriphilus TaxID=1689834 RepID=UPI001C07532C|nr:hypothetical protein [Acidithiobacillus ferriphilus]MBU2853433.1 hypothetical protein [Acidithiobacillus ferriphilus]
MLKYLVEPRTHALPAEGPDQYGVALHGLDTYWHHTLGPSFIIDLGNWPTRQEADAFVQHLKNNGPDLLHRGRDVEYVVVDERLLGYRDPPEKDAKFSTVQVLFEPGRGLLNNQQPVQHGFNQVRPATPADFEHYRVQLGSHEKYLTHPLEALARNYPVMVAGTLYKPTTPESAMKYYTAGKDDLLNGRMAPRVAGWEIWQYLVSGKLTPQLAAGAVENLHKLDVFDRASLLSFALEAHNDPNFNQFRGYEAAYYHAMSDAITQGAPIRDLGLKDMPETLQAFVRSSQSTEGKLMDKHFLENRFGSDAAFGIRTVNDFGQDDPNGRSVLPNGGSAVQGSSYAEYIRDNLPGHAVQIAGFNASDNPDSAYAQKEWDDGIDFAIVDQRYLIDPWPKLVLGESYPVVYDLNDPAGQIKVKEIYGDPQKWEYSKQPGQEATQRMEEFAGRAEPLATYSDLELSMYLAEAHINAIAKHPVVQNFREVVDMPGMTPSAIETYGNALLRNNSDLIHHFSGFQSEMEKIAVQGGLNPSEPKLQIIMQKIDQLPANFGKDRLFDATRLAVAVASPNLKP